MVMANMSNRKLLEISPKASAKIQEFMNREGGKDLIVRFGLVQTHCMGGAGYAYNFQFEQQIQDGEQSFRSDGVRFAIVGSQLPRIRGTSIEYVESMERQGFMINNPNAIAKCPCGHHDIFEPMQTENSAHRC